MKVLAALISMAALTLLVAVESAYAYDYDQDRNLPCYACHGLVGDETTQTVEAALLDGRDEPHIRKGPHGGYTATTSKCGTCHSVHGAAAGGTLLLPSDTIQQTCNVCHDGTGGTGVYGVIKARTGQDPYQDGVGAAHRIEVSGNNTIPGGSPDGGDRANVQFSRGNTLTCSDCHSVHDANTVEPFLGDRWRSSDGTSTVQTNRLLRRQPGGQIPGEEISTDVYGSEWCYACHRGHGVVEDPESSGGPINHPIGSYDDGEDRYHYGNALRWSDGSDGFVGPLGQSNAGYVMPDSEDGRPEGWPADGAPICQQCHEDSRNVGPLEVLPGQEFSITAPDGLPGDDPGPASTDNPRFQVFPHESLRPSFLPIDPEQGMDALCLRCHEPR